LLNLFHEIIFMFRHVCLPFHIAFHVYILIDNVVVYLKRIQWTIWDLCVQLFYVFAMMYAHRAWDRNNWRIWNQGWWRFYIWWYASFMVVITFTLNTNGIVCTILLYHRNIIWYCDHKMIRKYFHIGLHVYCTSYRDHRLRICDYLWYDHTKFRYPFYQMPKWMKIVLIE
jgi:hypothetical protein